MSRKEMLRKIVAGLMLAVLLIVVLKLAFDIQLVEGKTIIVPDDYPTIQEAINNANLGDTIYVGAGTYYENVVVNKTVFLIGENRSTTVVDGSGAVNTYVVSILADNVFIGGFTIQGPGPWEGGYWGISLLGNNNTVSKNIIHDLSCGITLYETTYNIIESNMIGPHGHAIELRSSSYNEIRNNVITSSSGGIYLDQFNHDTLVDNNTITYNHWGIIVQDSWNNLITKNIISTNDVGLQNVYIHFSNPWMPINSNNSIYHNNFINNTQQIDIYTGTPTDCWHNGHPSGGNYWSDYKERYPDAEELDDSGIYDTPYEIDADNIDMYPLVNPYVSILGDLNDDRIINLQDIAIAVRAFGSHQGHLRWNPTADINNDGKVNILDIATIAKDYGKTV